MAFSVLGSISRSRGYGGVLNLIHRSLSSSVSSRMSPGLMLQPSSRGEEGGGVVYDFFSLAENRVLSFESCSGLDPEEDHDTLVGSSQGWLGVINTDVEHLDHLRHIGLINPLTRCHIKLPSKGIRPNGLYHSKIILSCSPDEEEGECRALLAYGQYRHQLAFCCPGRSATWTPIDGSHSFVSGVYSRQQKLFFCTSGCKQLEALDLRDPLSPKLTLMDTDIDFSSGSDYSKSETENFLVINDDTDDLFIVTRIITEKTYQRLSVKGCIHGKTYDRFVANRFCGRWFSSAADYHDRCDDEEEDDDDCRPYKTITFDVRRYYPESRSFRYMDPGGGSLDGLSFFVDNNNGFVLSAEEFPELKPNSIYFTVWSSPAWDDTNFGGYDLGVYNYQDATISPCYHPSDSVGFRTMSFEPWWFIPNTTTKPN